MIDLVFWVLSLLICKTRIIEVYDGVIIKLIRLLFVRYLEKDLIFRKYDGYCVSGSVRY